MTVGESIDDLITNPNYIEARSKVSDDFIGLVKDMYLREWKMIEEREKAYQAVIAVMGVGHE